MSATKHTPAPWTFIPDEFGISGGPIRDAEGFEVAFGVRRQDAPIIAAAPELRDCCEWMQAAILTGLMVMTRPDDPEQLKNYAVFFAKLESAIEKAGLLR